MTCSGEIVAESFAGGAFDDQYAPGLELAVIWYAHGEPQHYIEISGRRSRPREHGDGSRTAQRQQTQRVGAFRHGLNRRAEFRRRWQVGPDRHPTAAPEAGPELLQAPR